MLRKEAPAAEEAFLDGDGEGHLDLPRIRAGGLGGGLFAVFVPSPEDLAGLDRLMQGETYDIPLPEPIDAGEALPVALAMIAILLRIEAASQGAVRICRTSSEISGCFETGALATVLHIEGAEAIAPDLDTLHVLHAAGLRSLGPVWSRPAVFGGGVPFRFPSDPDTGPGLTGAGKDLVRLCNELRIAVDLSHINEKGFRDVAAISDAPLIATHSNAHAVCPHSRNLTDRQLDAIRDTGGMVGVNLATCFLRPDGQHVGDTDPGLVLRHFDHLIARIGEDHVGFGSDFDGATIPDIPGDVAGLPKLLRILRDHGYDDELLARLCHGNWISVLKRTWGA